MTRKKLREIRAVVTKRNRLVASLDALDVKFKKMVGAPAYWHARVTGRLILPDVGGFEVALRKRR